MEDGTYEIEAYTKELQKQKIVSNKSSLMDIEVYDDLIQTATTKQNDISKENRFSKPKSKGSDPNQGVMGFGVKE